MLQQHCCDLNAMEVKRLSAKMLSILPLKEIFKENSNIVYKLFLFVFDDCNFLPFFLIMNILWIVLVVREFGHF